MGTTTAIANIGLSTSRYARTSRWLTYCTVLFADLIAFFAAGGIAVFTRYLFGAQFTPRDYLSFAPGVFLFLVTFAICGLYPGVACSPIEEFRLILRASAIGFLLLIGASFFLREGLLSSRIVLALAWSLAIVFVPLSRRILRGYCSLQPWWGIPTVIMGEREAGIMMMELLQGHSRLGLHPVALLTDDSSSVNTSLVSPQVFLGNLCHADRLAKDYAGCYAVIAMPTSGSDRVRDVLREHGRNYRNILLVPDMFGMRSQSVSARDVCGVLTLKLDQKLMRFFPQFLKRSFDLGVACSVILLISPLLVILCLLVKLSSKGPIFYGHVRIGKNQMPIKVWKFRTMVMEADSVLRAHLDADPQLRSEWERDHKLKRDPRVTRIGRFLRRSSLDELPQLWNVITGEMSLIGPRPIVDSEIEKYGDIFRQYQLVPPGLTGLWQISGRNNTSYEQRIRMDDYYVRNWSLSLDVYILLRTVKTILFSEGAY